MYEVIFWGKGEVRPVGKEPYGSGRTTGKDERLFGKTTHKPPKLQTLSLSGKAFVLGGKKRKLP